MSYQQGAETRSAVESIATFAAAARPEDLTPDIRQVFKRNILDSIGCAIAALPGRPLPGAARTVRGDRAAGRCTLIGGGKTSVDQAALFNSGLVRYVDLLSTHMLPGGLCHPSDNFGAVLAAAEHAGASGEEFMLALAVAYEIQCRFTAVVPVMAKGFNHAMHKLAISAAASAGAFSGSPPPKSRTRSRSPRSTTSLSRACMPNRCLSGGLLTGDDRNARCLRCLLGQARLHWPNPSFRGPKRAGAHVRAADPVDWGYFSHHRHTDGHGRNTARSFMASPRLEAVLDIKRRNSLAAADIEHVRCDIFQTGFEIAAVAVLV